MAARADLSCRRDGRTGVCVSVDGPHHDAEGQREKDRETRAALEDRGCRAFVVRHDGPLAERATAPTAALA